MTESTNDRPVETASLSRAFDAGRRDRCAYG